MFSLAADEGSRVGGVHIGSFELWSCLNGEMRRTASNQVSDEFLWVSVLCV